MAIRKNFKPNPPKFPIISDVKNEREEIVYLQPPDYPKKPRSEKMAHSNVFEKISNPLKKLADTDPRKATFQQAKREMLMEHRVPRVKVEAQNLLYACKVNFGWMMNHEPTLVDLAQLSAYLKRLGESKFVEKGIVDAGLVRDGKNLAHRVLARGKKEKVSAELKVQLATFLKRLDLAMKPLEIKKELSSSRTP